MLISLNRYGVPVTQMLKTMKLIAFIMLATCLHVSARGYAQKVSLDFQNVSIEKVLKEIKKQTGYLFLYKSEELKKAGKISIRVEDADIADAVAKSLAATPLTFKIVDRTIILKARTPDAVLFQLANQPPPLEVRGRITDNGGSPLVGANVTVKGTKNGTSTGSNGEFILKGVDENAVLEISFIGYATQDVRVNSRGKINVVLQLSENKLDEMVIIAYGKTSKRLNTGSVSSVTNETLEKQPVSDPLAALQGRVSGLMITSSNGMAGSGFQVRIRGENSMKQGNDPLYIIDGVPFISSPLNEFDGANGSQSPLNSINPNDIDRIDVLKDADATAIYGSRGANGVVLITTKKGKAGDSKVSFNIYTGYSKVSHKLDMLNTQQYLQLRKDAFRFDSVAATINNAPDLLTWDQNGYTNWQDLLIGNTGKITSTQVSFSGGNSQTRFLISTNYRRETSVLIGNLAFQKGGALLNITHDSKNNKFGITASANYNTDDNNSIPTDVTQYINLAPNYPKYNPDGSLYWFGNVQNPLGYLKRTYNTKTNSLIGNATLHYSLIKGLDLKSNFGYTQISMNQVLTLPESGFNPATYSGSSTQFGNSSVKSYIAEPQVTYTVEAGGGKLSLLAGASWQQSISDGQYLLATGFSSDALLKDISSATSITVRNSNYAQYNYQSFFGRVNYNLDQKYLLNATFRRDGSSRFGPGRQFGNFGAVGAAWIFSEEKFIADAIPVLSFGKLRGSYGTTGNDQIGDYQYLDSWSSAGFPYGGVSGLAPSRVFNAHYSWEVNKKLEIALDLGFLKDRILLTAGYYNNRSSNQLVGYSLSSQAGFSEYTANLPAKVENKGLEFDLNTINVKNKNFNWNTSFNLSIPKNTLLAYPGLENSADATSYEVGQSIRMVKGFKFTGVDPKTGLPTFLDVDKDGYISDPEDYVVMGQTMPQFFGGFDNQFTYKKLSLDIFFQFVKQEAPTLDYGPLVGTNGSMTNKGTYVLNYWNAVGNNTNVPRPTTTSSNPAYKAFVNNYVYSDAAWGDASYIRLKNVAVSYDLSSLTEKWKVSGTSIYVSGENLLTFTKYRGLDPEINGFDRRNVYPINPFGSVRPQAMPVLRIITVGLKFSL
jgi:TonB-dependent starch-binding outer membrane protein SusC